MQYVAAMFVDLNKFGDTVFGHWKNRLNIGRWVSYGGFVVHWGVISVGENLQLTILRSKSSLSNKIFFMNS